MTINLASLPAPQVIEELTFEGILADMKADLIARFPQVEPVLQLESSVAVKVLQACAYRELLLRARVNDAARSNLLAFSTGGDLDHIGATFGVERLVVTPATDSDPAVMEDDDRFRQRIQLGIVAYSVAGPIEAYIFHGLTADPSILDVAVNNPHTNRIEITVLSSTGNGAASSDQLERVADALSPTNARPLTDDVRVRSATIIEQPVNVRLVLPRGPAPEAVRALAETRIRAYCNQRRRIGRALRIDGIISAARSAGEMEQAIVEAPLADINPGHAGAVFVPSITVVTEIMP